MTYRTDILDFTNGVLRNLRVPTASANKMLVTDNQGRYQPRSIMKSASIIESDEELELLKGKKEKFSEVFNTWQRISRGGPTNTDTYLPAEINSWRYLPDTDTIVNPLNSASVIGFISPEKFDNWVLDTQMSSNQADDDFIGIILAHATDPVDGQTHLLTAFRGGNGLAPLVIDKDYYDFNARRYNVAKVLGGLTWCNGKEAALNGINGGNGSWINAGIGCRMIITRRGDLITIETSQFNSTEIHDPATITIDLSADPQLEVFRGEQSYGYCAMSQPNATWVVNRRPELRDTIVDIRDWSKWDWINETWVKSASSKATVIAQGLLHVDWLHSNPLTGKLFYLDVTQQLYRL